MHLVRLVLLVTGLTAIPLLLAQDETRAVSLAESAAFSAINEALAKTRQGGATPTEEDLKSRREAGEEAAGKARQFLKTFPNSSQAENARALLSMGLAEAALAGDQQAAQELQVNAVEIVQDPKVPDRLKLDAFVMNRFVLWAMKNGKRSLREESAEFQMAYVDAFFAAADVFSDKDFFSKWYCSRPNRPRNCPRRRSSEREGLLLEPAAPPANASKGRCPKI